MPPLMAAEGYALELRSATDRYHLSMCRSIKRLREGDVPATDEEIREAARQYVRKVSGFGTPSKRHQEAFDMAVDEVAAASRRLLESVTATLAG
jgi:hypothetical protein